VERRSDIEGLRAIAVLAVLLFHAGVPHLEGGYIGVDVFFVLSGFLITSLLVRERESDGGISLGEFYARRARRILPVSSLVAVVTVIASWIWLEPLRLRSLANDVIAVATFSSNFVFANRGADYLQSSLPPSPLQHYWSLAVEEQFYFVWPAVLALVCVGAASRIAIRRRVGILAITVSVVSFAMCMILMNTSQPWAFFAPHTRAFELSIGALFAVLPVATSKTAKIFSGVSAWIGLVVVCCCVVLFTETTRFPGPWALLPALATAFVLRGGNVASWSPHSVLKWTPFQ
jgi:peptidoglycan/LPS O-acetylase OafA/YrhL